MSQVVSFLPFDTNKGWTPFEENGLTRVPLAEWRPQGSSNENALALKALKERAVIVSPAGEVCAEDHLHGATSDCSC